MLGLSVRGVLTSSYCCRVRIGLWISACIAAFVPACSDDGTPANDSKSPTVSSLGEPCIPFDESLPLFSTSAGVTLYQHSTACGGEVCLAYQFQGRVTCPYGQSQADLTKPATDPARCRVTDATGKMTTAPVTVEVPPQLLDRRPEDSVYCTCACSGTEPDREYCSCPSDMVCEQLNAVGPRMAVTGICVRRDAPYDPRTASTKTCSRDVSDPSSDCGNDRENP